MTKTDLQKFLGQAEMTVAEWTQYDLNKDNEIQKREFVAVIDRDEEAKKRIKNEATTITTDAVTDEVTDTVTNEVTDTVTDEVTDKVTDTSPASTGKTTVSNHMS